MNKRATLALMIGAVAAPALAQMGGGRRRGGSGMEKGADKAGMEKGGEPRANMLEVTAHELHDDLKLTPQQEPLWDSYLEKLRALGNDIARERRPLGSAAGNVTQQIDHIVDIARNRLTALEDIAQAAKDLYAKLAPEQQPAANPRLANLMTMPLATANRGS
jgi:hypothetical protein